MNNNNLQDRISGMAGAALVAATVAPCPLVVRRHADARIRSNVNRRKRLWPFLSEEVQRRDIFIILLLLITVWSKPIVLLILYFKAAIFASRFHCMWPSVCMHSSCSCYFCALRQTRRAAAVKVHECRLFLKILSLTGTAPKLSLVILHRAIH